MNVSPLKYNKLIALKITQEDYEFLSRVAKGENVSVSEVLRQSIEAKKNQIWDEIYKLEQQEQQIEMAI